MITEGGNCTRRSEPAGLVELRPHPRLPHIWPYNRWDHEPVGHCTVDLVTRLSFAGPTLFETYDTVEHAVDRFVDRLLPQVWNGHVLVTDEDDVIVLGYIFHEEARQECGPYGWWFGVRRGFELLEQRWDPMEVAIWETIAREQP